MRKVDNSPWSCRPFGHQAGPKSPRRLPTMLPTRPITPVAAMTRAYLKGLRAAELAAWEITGGDYLLSGVFANDLRDTTNPSNAQA